MGIRYHDDGSAGRTDGRIAPLNLLDFVAMHESQIGPSRQILQRKRMSAFRGTATVAASSVSP